MVCPKCVLELLIVQYPALDRQVSGVHALADRVVSSPLYKFDGKRERHEFETIGCFREIQSVLVLERIRRGGNRRSCRSGLERLVAGQERSRV